MERREAWDFARARRWGDIEVDLDARGLDDDMVSFGSHCSEGRRGKDNSRMSRGNTQTHGACGQRC